MLLKNIIRQIRHSLGRYLAIFAIIFLGVGFFAGLKVTKEAMVKTGSDYFEELGFFDFRLVSTLGLTDEDVEEIRKLDCVGLAYGSVSADLLAVSSDGSDTTMLAHQLLDGINDLELVEGRLPEKADECVVDSKFMRGRIGQKIELSKNNSEDVREKFAFDSYTIVGVASSPYYINFERGNSSLGKISGFVYMTDEAFTHDYYTEIFLRLKDRYEVYSEEYDEYADKCQEKLEEVIGDRAQLRYEKMRGDALKEIHDAEEELADGRKEYEESKADTLAQISDAIRQISKGEQDIKQGREDIRAGYEELDNADLQVEEAEAKLQESEAQLRDAQEKLEAAKQAGANLPQAADQSLLLQLQELEKQADTLTESRRKLEEKKAYLKGERDKLDEAVIILDENEAELEAARKELDDNQKKASEEFRKAEDELKEGQEKIDDGYKKVEDIREPSTFCLGRSTNIGYNTLQNDTDIVSGISKVFPLFFFIVASLVCVTTMTRMVDEQRVQNGVLKALGYSDGAIISQYMIYAGSASVLGCITGFLVGSRYMPMVLWEIYHIMYAIDRPIKYILDWKLFAVCACTYLIASLGATWLAASSDLREAAAELIRPKSPAAGKRVLLERIEFIWKRVKFLHKVSIRNIFRYKKRMFMMILGVGGCTALLLTGFGIRDSIQPIVDYQYDEIHCYDSAVSFMDDMTPEQQESFKKENSEVIDDIVFVHSESMDVLTNGSSDSVTLVAADNIGKQFVNLHRDDEQYAYPGRGEVIIDYRLATAINISIGDTLELRNSDYQVLKLKVSGIFDNYIYDFAYISLDTYREQITEAENLINCAYVNIKPGCDVHEASSDFLAGDNCASVSVNADMITLVGNMLSSLDYVVLIVLVCAGALAFIVIYNLTNISINERIREIATIKVLGFYEGESAAYVFRENLVLTIISAVFGLPMGIALHRYVMAQIKIKSMYFGHRILPASFIWAFVMTFVFAVIVDFFMYFRLKKVNMAESLKAIE